MPDQLVKISDDFWNIRGSFRVGGLLDVGTQCSLIRSKRGGFVLLDAYTLHGEVAREVFAHTDGGRAVRAILNLHPFHNRHVRASAAQFPQALLYGTSRHQARAPELAWQPQRTDDPALHALFSDDFSFSVPRGVDLVPSHGHSHFASVLALHEASGTLHVDDTLSFSTLPLVGGLMFHPTLGQALQKRPGAATDFRTWAEELVAMCARVKRVCTAHMRQLPPKPGAGVPAPADQVRAALDSISKKLEAHARRYG